MGRQRDAAKWELWRRRLREFDRGRAAVVDYCERLGVSTASFYKWQRKLRGEANGSVREGRGGGHGTTEHRPAAHPLRFLPVEITASAHVEALLPGGVRLLVPSRDHEALRTVVAALLGTHGKEQPC
jgi:hypothetical protein